MSIRSLKLNVAVRINLTKKVTLRKYLKKVKEGGLVDINCQTESSRENGQWKGPEAGASPCHKKESRWLCGQKDLGKRGDRRSKAAGKTFSSEL